MRRPRIEIPREKLAEFCRRHRIHKLSLRLAADGELHAREAIASAQGRVRTDLDHDRIWALGLVECIEIIGEAGLPPEAVHPIGVVPTARGARDHPLHDMNERSGRLEAGLPWRGPKPTARGGWSLGKMNNEGAVPICSLEFACGLS